MLVPTKIGSGMDFPPNCDDLGGDVDGGSDGDEFLGVQLMTMYKYAVKIDAQYEKYDGCQHT